MSDHASDLRVRVPTGAIESAAKHLVTGHALEEALEADALVTDPVDLGAVRVRLSYLAR